MANYRLFLGTAFLTYIVVGMMLSAIGPTLPSVRSAFDLSLSAVGLFFVAQAGGFFLATILAGVAADRGFGRPVMLGGTLLFAAGLAGFALTDNWTLALIYLFVSGVGGGGQEGSMNPLAMHVEPERRGFIINLLHVFPCVGAIAGPVMAYLAMQAWGWQAVYLLLAGATVLLLPLLYLARFPRPAGLAPAAPRAQARGAARAATPAAGVMGGRLVPPAGRLALGMLRHPLAWLLAATMWVYVAVEMGITGWVYTYAVEGRGLLPAVGTASVSLFWVGLLLGRIAVARLSVSRDNLVLVGWGGGLGAAGVLGLLLWPQPAATVAAVFVAGLGAAGIFPLLVAEAGDRFPGSVGSVSGLVIATAGIGGLTGPSVMGVLADHLGLAATMVLALLLFLGIVLLAAGCRTLAARGATHPAPSSRQEREITHARPAD